MRERFKEGRVRLEWKKRRFFAERDENRGSGKRERQKKFGIENWRKGIEAKKGVMGEDKGSRFNRWYKEVKGEGIPGYLKK